MSIASQTAYTYDSIESWESQALMTQSDYVLPNHPPAYFGQLLIRKSKACSEFQIILIDHIVRFITIDAILDMTYI